MRDEEDDSVGGLSSERRARSDGGKGMMADGGRFWRQQMIMASAWGMNIKLAQCTEDDDNNELNPHPPKTTGKLREWAIGIGCTMEDGGRSTGSTATTPIQVDLSLLLLAAPSPVHHPPPSSAHPRRVAKRMFETRQRHPLLVHDGGWCNSFSCPYTSKECVSCRVLICRLFIIIWPANIYLGIGIDKCRLCVFEFKYMFTSAGRGFSDCAGVDC